MQRNVFCLYIDDSGSRYPDKVQKSVQKSAMNYFALGGILIHDDNVASVIDRHKTFCQKWQINYPLHSTEIRGQRKNFSWLALDEIRKERFLSELQLLIMDLPIISIAAVIDRTGYMNRYIEVYNDKTWLMCKTAFSILVERAAKFVQARKAQLEIYFESSGKREDRAIKEYVRSLKSVGMPFAYDSSAAYNALLPSDFRALVLGEPRERTKNTPMMQLADLVLYPIAKGGYDPTYPPYQALRRHQRIIDVIVETEKIRELGVKYSCFPSKKQDPAEAGS